MSNPKNQLMLDKPILNQLYDARRARWVAAEWSARETSPRAIRSLVAAEYKAQLEVLCQHGFSLEEAKQRIGDRFWVLMQRQFERRARVLAQWDARRAR